MLYDFTADWSNFYIVMEVLQGGELMDRITKKGATIPRARRAA